MMQYLSFVCLFVFINLSSQPAFSQIPSIPTSPDGQNLTWKVALMTGDDELDVFDNARKTLRNVFVHDGVAPGNIRELSVSRTARVKGVLASSASGLERALQDLSVGDRDACLIHMTSHGSPLGFYLKNTAYITPSALNTILEQSCGDRPTVVLISACYSGVFVSRAMLKPNRIILTAARSDRTSFGCSAEEQYTYWDGCLIDSLPRADTWKSLYGTIEGCVTTKESKGRFRPSYPQAYFGEQVSDLRIPSATVQQFVNFESPSFRLDGASVACGSSPQARISSISLFPRESAISSRRQRISDSVQSVSPDFEFAMQASSDFTISSPPGNLIRWKEPRDRGGG
jgi:hypothetical protein